MQLGRLVGHEDAHVQVAVGRGGDADLAQQMDAVGGLGDAHGLEVGAAEGREVAVGEVLHGGEVLRLVFCGRLVSDVGGLDASEQAHGDNEDDEESEGQKERREGVVCFT